MLHVVDSVGEDFDEDVCRLVLEGTGLGILVDQISAYVPLLLEMIIIVFVELENFLSLMFFIASKHRLGLFSCGLESRTDGAPSEQILVEVARKNHRGLIKDGPDSIDAYDVTSTCFGKDFSNIFTMACLQNYQVNH